MSRVRSRKAVNNTVDPNVAWDSFRKAIQTSCGIHSEKIIKPTRRHCVASASGDLDFISFSSKILSMVSKSALDSRDTNHFRSKEFEEPLVHLTS